MLHDFYNSKSWIDLLSILKSERIQPDGYIHCEHCGKPIIHKYDCIGHHTISLTTQNYRDVTISLNSELIMLVHHKCHNKIHNRFGFTPVKKVYLVYGAPCSGKTTFVKNNAEQNDLVVDLDSIWQAISINDRYIKPNELKQNVFAIRDTLIDQVKTRYGRWQRAWVIGGYPRQMDRQRIVNSLGAEEIFIEQTKDFCLSNINEKNPEWKQYIETWFDSYQPTPPLLDY